MISPLVVSFAFLALAGAMVHRFTIERDWSVWAGILPRVYLAVIYIGVWAGSFDHSDWASWGRGGLLALIVGDVLHGISDYVRYRGWSWRFGVGVAGAGLSLAGALLVLR